MVDDPAAGDEQGDRDGVFESVDEGLVEAVFKSRFGRGAQIGRECHAAVLMGQAVIGRRPGGGGGLVKQMLVMGGTAGVSKGSGHRLNGCTQSVGIDHQLHTVTIHIEGSDDGFIAITERFADRVVSDVDGLRLDSEQEKKCGENGFHFFSIV